MSGIRIALNGVDGAVWLDPDMVGGWAAFPHNGTTWTVLFTHGMKRIAIVKESPAEVAEAFAQTAAQRKPL